MTDQGARIGVLTLSDKGSRGERADTSGPLLAEMVRHLGIIACVLNCCCHVGASPDHHRAHVIKRLYLHPASRDLPGSWVAFIIGTAIKTFLFESPFLAAVDEHDLPLPRITDAPVIIKI